MKLEVNNITKSFEEKEILHNISFEANGGAALGLLGRNGAGKTTTIRIIMDVFHANNGEVLLDGEKFHPDKNLIGYLPEERGLYLKKKILDQMIYLARLRGNTKADATASAKKWLERMGLSAYAYKNLEVLSKGNQQKVQLASTLMCNPDIVILDEPFSGLDPVNSQLLKDVVNETIDQGKIVIFSSHQMSYVEEFCHDIVIIDKGDIALSGNLSDIKKEFGQHRRILSALNKSIDELQTILKTKLASQAKIVTIKNNNLVIELMDEEKQWDFLEALKKENIEIEHFGLYEPSLNDIFIASVDKNNEFAPDTAKEVE